MRELKGLEIAARYKITHQDGVWLVPSQSGNGTYTVTLMPHGDSCTCDDFGLTGKPCKHVFAARIVRQRDHGGAAVPLDTTVIPKRPTYKQDWPAYDLAQTTEKHRLQELLADLCAGVQEPPRKGGPKGGRPPIPLADRIFACAFNIYCGLSHRRFTCDMADARKRGYLSRTMHYTKLSSYLCDEDMTAALRGLVARSALPLRAIETDFAVDSSGFSTSKFVRWYDEKYGVERSGRDWVKVHICTGVRTNVVTAVEIRDRDANDCPLLPPLVKATAEHFRIGEVSADKAYLSAENVEVIASVGGTPFIAPKITTTGGVGGLFERMFHYYQFRRDEFLAHYHKRSNVESTFSAIKRMFGDSVRSRTEVAMRNEVLCKILCHNICCLIHSQCELGIEPIFWQNKAAGPPAVLPLVRPG